MAERSVSRGSWRLTAAATFLMLVLAIALTDPARASSTNTLEGETMALAGSRSTR